MPRMISKAQQERMRKRNADPAYQATDRYKRGQQMSDDAALDLERKRIATKAKDEADFDASMRKNWPKPESEMKPRQKTTPYLPPIGGAVNYAEMTRPKKKAVTPTPPASAPKKEADTASGPKWKQYKSVAAAKKAGSKYYMGKDGKKKAALFKEDLDPTLSKRDAYNKALGLKRADGSAVQKAKPKKDTKGKADTKKKSFRERRLDRQAKRLESAKTEGQKRRIKRRMGRVEDRIERADKREEARKPKKMLAGGAVKKPAVPGYKKGGKVRGAGIARKGVRACKIVKA